MAPTAAQARRSHASQAGDTDLLPSHADHRGSTTTLSCCSGVRQRACWLHMARLLALASARQRRMPAEATEQQQRHRAPSQAAPHTRSDACPAGAASWRRPFVMLACRWAGRCAERRRGGGGQAESGERICTHSCNTIGITHTHCHCERAGCRDGRHDAARWPGCGGSNGSAAAQQCAPSIGCKCSALPRRCSMASRAVVRASGGRVRGGPAGVLPPLPPHAAGGRSAGAAGGRGRHLLCSQCDTLHRSSTTRRDMDSGVANMNSTHQK